MSKIFYTKTHIREEIYRNKRATTRIEKKKPLLIGANFHQKKSSNSYFAN